ncbi:MAG: hypothetical protein QOF60_1810 [Actinomycetota bacterium]|jgi:hypothetical protein|nr:hypothetical protein [Actinomycetota bacterium]
MPTWLLLLSIPVALAVPCVLLAVSALVEEHVLSPRSMILSAVRAKHGGPELTEALVTREFERLLKNAQR